MKIFYRLPLLIFLLCFAVSKVKAQQINLEQLFNTTFVADMVANPKTSDVVISVNEKGARNLYLLSAPAYQLKKITNFNNDEGIEITSLKISDDGLWAVFVRGGDHGANTAVQPIKPNSSLKKGNISLYSLNLKTLAIKLLDEGNFPVIHPNSREITYLKENELKSVAINGVTKPQSFIQDRGIIRQYQWSPDGTKMVFVSRRSTHSFIGMYEKGKPNIKWLAPSYHKDDLPVWSPDGKKIAFIRQEGDGVGKDSVNIKTESKWQTVIYDLQTKAIETVYKAGNHLRISTPRDFTWVNASTISFTSFQDGWPHIYAINPIEKTVAQLTKGNYSVDNITYSNDGSKIAFCANYGDLPEDIDRKQLGIIDLNTKNVKFVTKGDHIFTKPRFIKADKALVLLSSTTTQPTLPAVIDFSVNNKLTNLGSKLLGDFNFDELIRPTHVRYKAADGLEVYGQLFTPKNLKGKAPAIVYIHGGPRRQMYLGWNHLDYYFYDYAFNQYLASQGYVVLSINYRSGTGYGYAYQNAPKTNKNGAAEYQDILAGGQWLGQQNFVNADKIGVYGGSYGGFLTGMALAKNSDVFKAGVDIHGMHLRILNPGLPASLNKTELTALHSSPSFWVDGWKSPALIIHGDDDQNVPFVQSIDIYNRLKARNVAVETLVIPDETHHWMLFENLMRVKKATFNFLDKHLK